MKPVHSVSFRFSSATPCAKEKGKWFSVFRFPRKWAQFKFPASPRRFLLGKVASWTLPFPGTCECWKFCSRFYLPCHTQHCHHFPLGIPWVLGIYWAVSKWSWITGINRRKRRCPVSPDGPETLDCFWVSLMN